MSLKAFLDGYRAARNGPSWGTEPPERPWRQDARPEWMIDEAPPRGSDPAERELAELRALLNRREADVARLQDERRRDRDECEALRRDIAARDAVFGECQALVAELNTELARVKATRDRYQANGKKAAAARDTAQARIAELDEQLAQRDRRLGRFKTVLKIAGAKKALVKLAHPDMHPNAGAAERRALNETFQTLTAVFDEMESEE